jgi:hypothetical protein
MPDTTLMSINSNLITSINIKPTAIDEFGAPPPENSEIRKIAESVLGAAKMSLAAVASNPNRAVRSGSLEATFQQAFKLMPEKKRQSYVTKAKALIEAPADVRKMMFGLAGERDFESHLAAGGFDRFDEGLAPLAIDKKLLGIRDTIRVPRTALRTTAEGLLIPGELVPGGADNFESNFESANKQAEESKIFSADNLEEIWGTSYASDPFSGGIGGSDGDFEEFAVTDKMGFWITKIKCVDETNPEWWGHDEIALAGVSVDEDGDTKKIAEKYIGGGFDDGDSKGYNNWRYHMFGLREGQHWPKTYSVTLLLAEKDNGGFANFLNQIWVAIRDKVKAAIEKAITGALSSYLGPVIAAAIGKAVAWIVDVLVGWIIRWWNDDIFPAFTARVTTPSMSARWYYPNGTWGNPSSGLRTAHFYGHGGHYYAQYYWKFYS